VGGSSGSSSGYIGPPPPGCDFALPDICEACDDGETVCAHYAIENGTCVAETCPPSSPTVPLGGTCSQGASCQPNSGCGTASAGGGCSESCNCDATGHYQCTENCGTVSPPPMFVCAQGQACVPGTACANGSDNSYGCDVNCTCVSPANVYDCTYDCGFGAADAGAAEDATPLGQ
jgi:hypothetical protein